MIAAPATKSIASRTADIFIVGEPPAAERRGRRTIKRPQASRGTDSNGVYSNEPASRRGLRPIAAGDHLSAVTKHDQSPGIFLDADSINGSGDLEINVPIE